MKTRWLLLLGVAVLGLIAAGCAERSSDSASPEPEGTVSESTLAETTETTTAEPSVEPGGEIAGGVIAGSSDEIVAYANGQPVYRDEFESAKSSLISQSVMSYAQFGMDYNDMLQGADGRLRELSVEAEAMYRVFGVALVEAEAEARGVLPSSAAIDEAFETQYQQILEGQGMSEADLQDYVETQGSTLEEFRKLGRDAVSWRLTLEAITEVLTGVIDSTVDELQAYLDEHADDYSTPAEINASHILFPATDIDLREYLAEHADDYAVDGTVPEFEEVRDQLRAAIRAEAERALSDLKGGDDFVALAEELMGPEAGNLGWFSQSIFGEDFERRAFALDPGEVSDVVETLYGFHIIRLNDRRDAVTPELADIIDEVQTALADQIRTDALQTFMTDAYEQGDFEIGLPLLDAVWGQQADPDRTIEKLEALVEEGLPSEPYLGYVLATMYEMRLEEAIGEKAALESDANPTSELQEQIAALDDQMAHDIERAIFGYRLALASVGEDPLIQEKLDALEAQSSAAEEAVAP